MRQVNAKLSDSTFTLLKHLAHQQQATYADIIEKALLAYEPSAGDSISPPITELQKIIDAALQPVLARLHALESLGLVKPLSPDQGIIVSVAPSDLGGFLSASDATGIDELGSTGITAEIAVESEIEALPEDHQKPSSSIPSKLMSALPPIREAIAELKRKGFTPQQAADELNKCGYRTKNNTLIKRGYVNNVMKEV